MNPTPLVTTIVLTYMNFNFLEKTLNSIFSQKYPKIELIISDDASYNYNEQYIKRLLKNKPKNIQTIKIIHHLKNLGTVKNINNCLKIATGEYFIGLASDDEFYDEHVMEDVVNFFQNNRSVLICTSKRQYITEEGNEISILPHKSDIRYLQSSYMALSERLSISNFISASCTFISKKLIDKYGYYDEQYKLLEDYPLYIKLSKTGEQIHFFDRITVKHRRGGVSNSKTVNPLLKKDGLDLMRKEILPFLKKNNSELYKWKLACYDYGRNKNKFSPALFLKHKKYFILKVLEKLNLLQINPEKFIGVDHE